MISECDIKQGSEQKASTRPTGHFDEKYDDIFYVKSLCEKNCPLSDYKNLDPTYMGKDTRLFYCSCSFENAMKIRQKAKGIGKKNSDEYYTHKSLKQELRWRTIFQENFVPDSIKSWGHDFYMQKLENRMWTCKKIWEYSLRKKIFISPVIPQWENCSNVTDNWGTLDQSN